MPKAIPPSRAASATASSPLNNSRSGPLIYGLAINFLPKNHLWTYQHPASHARRSRLSRRLRYSNECGQRKRNRQPTKREILTPLARLINQFDSTRDLRQIALRRYAKYRDGLLLVAPLSRRHSPVPPGWRRYVPLRTAPALRRTSSKVGCSAWYSNSAVLPWLPPASKLGKPHLSARVAFCRGVNRDHSCPKQMLSGWE